jgi:nucleoside-diphosphate-sugar epimerase
MKVVVLGATGIAGRSALPHLISAGHEVIAHARSDASAARAGDLGAHRVVRGDTFDLAELRQMLGGADAAIDLRVSIPSGAAAALPSSWSENTRLRDEGSRRLVDAAREAGVPRLVRDTVTFVYADGGDAWLDEATPVDAPGLLACNLAAERHLDAFTAAGGVGVTLRFGLFYGPSDEASTELLAQARKGFVSTLVGPGNAFHSAIHTADVGSAVAAALNAPAGIYNVVDDEPLRRDDLAGILAAAVGRRTVRRPPTRLAAMTGAAVRALMRSQRVSNQHFRAVTGWAPSVPSRRSGWPDAIEQMTQAGK